MTGLLISLLAISLGLWMLFLDSAHSGIYYTAATVPLYPHDSNVQKLSGSLSKQGENPHIHRLCGVESLPAPAILLYPRAATTPGLYAVFL